MKHLLDTTSGEDHNPDVTIKAVDHVIDFNLRGLQRIENDLFFPWLRNKLTEGNEISAEVKQSFGNVLDIIDKERRKVEELATLMVCAFQLLLVPQDSMHSYFAREPKETLSRKRKKILRQEEKPHHNFLLFHKTYHQ